MALTEPESPWRSFQRWAADEWQSWTKDLGSAIVPLLAFIGLITVITVWIPAIYNYFS
jgi:hypothetical protein